MKIMLIANDSTYTYKLRKEILERFVLEGHELIILNKKLKFIDEFESMGIRTIDIDNKRHGMNPFNDLDLLIRYVLALKKIKPDIVFSYNIKPNVYGGLACRMLSIPYFPNITGLGTALEYNGVLQKLTSIMYRLALKRSKAVFFQNSMNRDFFYNRGIINKDTDAILLPGSGVNISEYKPMPYPNNKNINFLFIARILKEKGIDLYIEAAKYIHNIYPNTIFNICGLCDDERYIEKLENLKKYHFIIYHGEQKDLKKFYEKAACIVHPSYYPEGMCNVLLEAAAFGRPCICTDRAGCRETVDNGKSGYIVPIKDQEALNRAIKSFLELPYEKRREMGMKAREKIEREFDRELVVEKYMEALKDI